MHPLRMTDLMRVAHVVKTLPDDREENCEKMLQAVAVLDPLAAGWEGFRNFPFIGVFLLTMRSDYSWRSQSISCSHRCLHVQPASGKL